MTRCARRLLPLSVVLGLTFVAAQADAQVAVTSVTSVTAVSAGPKLGDFQVAVSNYYKVAERDVVMLHDRSIRDEELPVVLFIAQSASLAPSTVVDLRVRGFSWWDISVRYHLGPEAFYVPVAGNPGPPYGAAYGQYKKPKNQWNTIVLTDADIVNLVQLRFLSEYYHASPERVMEVRARSADFVAVEREISGRGASNGRGRGRGGQ